MRATLAEVLQPALAEGYAVAGLVCLGWEDARAYAHAAQMQRLPVILQAGPGCRRHTPLPVLAAMLGSLADDVDVPVVLHLDHGKSKDECREAIDCGFTSVMFDGSHLPFAENVEQTAEIVEVARAANVSSEGEIGFVGYFGGSRSEGTDHLEAAAFAEQTGVDAIAISVGNVHLQESARRGIDREVLGAIEATTSVPLVIHGGSGVPADERQVVARETSVCKFNIGTELRMAFAKALRKTLADDPRRFDRVEILGAVEAPLVEAARLIIRNIGPEQAR
ncbi:MAG: class II fructose-bisphosphate aldolase [Rhizobiaceae bacterium]